MPILKQVVKYQQATAEEEKAPKWASEFCAAMAREVKSALASKPTPPVELKPLENRVEVHRVTSTTHLRASGVAKLDTFS